MGCTAHTVASLGVVVRDGCDLIVGAMGWVSRAWLIRTGMVSRVVADLQIASPHIFLNTLGLHSPLTGTPCRGNDDAHHSREQPNLQMGNSSVATGLLLRTFVVVVVFVLPPSSSFFSSTTLLKLIKSVGFNTIFLFFLTYTADDDNVVLLASSSVHVTLLLSLCLLLCLLDNLLRLVSVKGLLLCDLLQHWCLCVLCGVEGRVLKGYMVHW